MKSESTGNYLVAKWLGLCTPTAKGTGSILVREPRSHAHILLELERKNESV